MPDTPPRTPDRTIRDHGPETPPLPPPSSLSFDAAATQRLEREAHAARYVARNVLGQGGMGEVRLCSDVRIGRDVAMKIIKPGVGGGADVQLRFLREARLQGQLEHPAIVPVYDLATSSEGAYFTMKRIRGETLHDVVQGIAVGDEKHVKRYGLRKLLSSFVQVAQAVAYAHARGVVHRDLKPANVMLGDYGEVYVLDWGLGKVLGTADVAIEPGGEVELLTRTGSDTLMGEVMGTPGYMPPEQALGKHDLLDARADVYALGTILFEVLTLEPLHPVHDAQTAIGSTLAGADPRPTVRAPAREVPPELDAICVKATAFEPSDRYAHAGELAAAVERFLDGDRDLALRRSLAADQIQRAKTALENDAHTDALRALNRALALDPHDDAALRMLTELLLHPPKELPAAAEEELRRDDENERRTTARVGTFAFLGWFMLSPLLLWAGVRVFGTWVALVAVTAASAIGAAVVAFRRARPTDRATFVVLASSTIAIAMATLYLGPFVLVPGWACQNTLVFAMHAAPGWKRWGTIAFGSLAILGPLALELLGLMPPSFAFEAGRLVLLPRMIELPPVPTLILLAFGNVAMVFVPSMIVSRIRDEAVEAKRRLQNHLWHLRQLVPAKSS